MQNNYLIPANTKKSQLILGFFTRIDLIIIVSGWVVTLLLLLIIGFPSLGIGILILLPGLIATFLVIPVMYYHNILQLLTNIINFILNRRIYYWKGWNIYEEFSRDNK